MVGGSVVDGGSVVATRGSKAFAKTRQEDSHPIPRNREILRRLLRMEVLLACCGVADGVG